MDDSHVDHYQYKLNCYLSDVVLPVSALACSNSMCCCPDHRQAISNYAQVLINCCGKAASEAFPHSRTGDRKIVPGLTELVEPFRQKSLFWHNIWVDCGRPRDGNLAGIMRRTRAAYHAAVKRVKRDEKDITRKRFAESLASHNTRDFWSEIKKITGSKKGCLTWLMEFVMLLTLLIILVIFMTNYITVCHLISLRWFNFATR